MARASTAWNIRTDSKGGGSARLAFARTELKHAVPPLVDGPSLTRPLRSHPPALGCGAVESVGVAIRYFGSACSFKNLAKYRLSFRSLKGATRLRLRVSVISVEGSRYALALAAVRTNGG